MRFKIDKIYQQGKNLQVEISHEHCIRQVYSFPVEYYKNNKFMAEIKKSLKEQYESKKETITKEHFENKDFDTDIE